MQGELGVADEAAKACLKRHTLKKGGKWCGGEGKWCGGGGKCWPQPEAATAAAAPATALV